MNYSPDGTGTGTGLSQTRYFTLETVRIRLLFSLDRQTRPHKSGGKKKELNLRRAFFFFASVRAGFATRYRFDTEKSEKFDVKTKCNNERGIPIKC